MEFTNNGVERKVGKGMIWLGGGWSDRYEIKYLPYGKSAGAAAGGAGAVEEEVLGEIEMPLPLEVVTAAAPAPAPAKKEVAFADDDDSDSDSFDPYEEAEEFKLMGRRYWKLPGGECWVHNSDGSRGKWAGVFNRGTGRIDTTAKEPESED